MNGLDFLRRVSAKGGDLSKFILKDRSPSNYGWGKGIGVVSVKPGNFVVSAEETHVNLRDDHAFSDITSISFRVSPAMNPFEITMLFSWSSS